MPILVDMPSRGTQYEFPDEATPEQIQAAMLEAFPRNGEDVAWDLQDTSFEPSLEDFKKYRSHMEEKKVDWGDALIGGAGEIAKRVGKGILGLAEFESAAQVPGTAVEGVAAGTYSLYGVLAQSDNPASPLFKFKDWVSGTGTDRGQYGQFLEARKVWKNIREAEEGGETISGIDPAYVNQDVRNALELVADPSVFIPFAGGPKAAALAARAAGRVGHAAGTGVRAVGRAGTAVGAVPEFATTLGARAIGAPAEAAAKAGRGAGSLTTLAGVGEVGLGAAGAGVGLPFGTAAATFTGAKIIGGGLDAAGEAMQHLSRSMGTGASRTGAFAALAADESASLGARTLGGIGRRFGADAILPYVGSAAAGVGIGAGVGGTLGYLSQGEEGLFGGLGGGMVLGATGGLAGRGISHLTGGVRSQRIMGDASRAIALMPEAEGAKAQILVERFAKEGNTEAIAEVIDAKGWLGEEAPMKFVRDDEVVMKPDGTPAMVMDADGNMVPLKGTDIPFKGVHFDDASNTIYINVERAEGGTAFHESLHGALRTSIGKQYAKPMADALMKNLNDNQLGAFIWRYVDYKGLKGKAREQAKNDFLADPLKALEEINADYFMDFLQRRENRDLLLTGKRSVDNIILGNLKNAYDSVLHKLGMSEEYKLTGRRDDPFTGHKAVDSLVRELIDARRVINKRNVKQGTMATPVDLSTPAKILTFNKEHGMDHAIIRDEKGNPIGVKDEATLRREMFEMGLKIDEALKDIPGAKEDFLSDKALAAMKPILPPEIFAKLMTFRALRDGGKVASIANSPVGGKKGEQTLIFPRGIKESDTLIHSARRSNTPKPKKDGTYSARQMNRGLGLLLKTIDLSMLRNRADEFFSRPGMLDPWGGDKAAAMADVKRYAENLASDAPTPSAEFFGGGRNGAMKRDILNKIWGAVIKAKQSELVMNENALGRNVRKESSGGGELLIGKPGEGKHTRVTEDIRVDRVGKITETGESYRYTEGEVDPVTGRPTGAYAGMQVNFQPDSFTPEKLPGGEAFVHESGYNILQKGRGKFRVYKPDGELLGLRDTMKSASSLAGRNYRKGVARFQPSPEIDPLGMFSKAESAALELKQAKGSGQQMLAMIKKAGVKDEELQALGLDKFLEGNRRVTKDEIIDYLVENQITVEETMLGGDVDHVKVERLERQVSEARKRRPKVTVDEAYEAANNYDTVEVWNGDQFLHEISRPDAAYQLETYRQDPGNTFHLRKQDDPYYLLTQELSEAKNPVDTPQYDSYVEPGAVEGSYRELLLRLPEKTDRSGLPEGYSLVEGTGLKKWEVFGPGTSRYSSGQTKAEAIGSFWDMHGKAADYTGGHYGEYSNTLAHIRFQDRQSEKYGKVLDIQEIQSDWHQEGRKKGYQGGETVAEVQKLAHADREKFYSGKGKMSDAEWNALSERVKQWDEREAAAAGAVPDAPFKTSWHELAMKRMIKYAADNGYDAIAWTKGETQAARYDLSKQVEYIDVEAVAEVDKLHFVDIRVPGEKDIHLEVENGIVREGDYKGKGLDEIVGKDVADKVFALERGKTKRLAGADLKVGGEGMKGFYDKMLPKMKTWKKLGLKVEEGGLDTGDFRVFRDNHKTNPYRLVKRHSPDIISRHPTSEAAWAAAGKLGDTPAHIVRLSPEVKAKVVEEGMARFQPAEPLTNGTAWRTADGYNVLQKGKRGKFRAYAPSGKLIGIYDQLKTAQKAAIRRLEKESGADQARFMPAEGEARVQAEKFIAEHQIDNIRQAYDWFLDDRSHGNEDVATAGNIAWNNRFPEGVGESGTISTTGTIGRISEMSSPEIRQSMLIDYVSEVMSIFNQIQSKRNQ